MVFRSRFSRPKPNLAAAKKSQVTVKPSVSGSEDEKPVTSTSKRISVGEAAAASSTSSHPPQAPLSPLPPPVPPPPPPPPPPQTTTNAIPLEIPEEIPELKPKLTGGEHPSDDPDTRPTRPMAIADRSPSKSEAERDESPLFIPRPSEQRSENSPTLTAVPPMSHFEPAPANRQGLAVRRRALEHRTDLDEVYADSESSDGTDSVVSDADRRRLNLENFLMRKEARRQPSEPRYRPNVRRLGNTAQSPMDRSSVTMRDLIYYTNRNNPPPTYRREREMRQFGKSGCAWYSEETPGPVEAPEHNQPAPNANAESTSSMADEQIAPAPPAEVKDEKPPTPKKKVVGGQAQFVLDADGNIVLNEESLVIRREYTDEDYIDVKQDGIMGTATYSSFRKQKPRSKKWSLRETIRLYKALSTVGTDFSFMARLFKYRTREEIKRKFKREEKARPAIVDRVLSKRKHFDLSILDDTSDSEMSNNSSSDSDDDAIKVALLDPDNPVPELLGPNGPRRFRRSRGRGYRREQRFKEIEVEEVPQNPNWHLSKTAYVQENVPQPPPAKRSRIWTSEAAGVVDEVVDSVERRKPLSASVPASPAPALAPSPAPSAGILSPGPGGAVRDVLSRLIDQKMREVSARGVVSPPPLRSRRDLTPPPPPEVRNRSLSLDDFCKFEANLQS